MKNRIIIPLLAFILFAGQQINAQNLATLKLETVNEEMNLRNYVLLKATLTNNGYSDGIKIENPYHFLNADNLSITQFGKPLQIEPESIILYGGFHAITIEQGKSHSFFLSFNLDRIKNDDNSLQSKLYDIQIKILLPSSYHHVNSNSIQVNKRM